MKLTGFLENRNLGKQKWSDILITHELWSVVLPAPQDPSVMKATVILEREK